MRSISSFIPFNDEDTTLGRIMALNQRRKQKAAQDAYYRDIRAQVLQTVLEGVPRHENLKRHMQICQALTDNLMPVVMEGKTDE